MDPSSIILKKTVPADLAKNKKAIDTLAKNSFKQNPLQFLPFQVFEKIAEDEEEQTFLKCSYNYTEKAYRSPHTNRYYLVRKIKKVEEIDIYEKTVPDDEQDLRDLEKASNIVWSAYTSLYYGMDAVGSVYLKPRGKDGAYEGIFGIHKVTDDKKGYWDSVHLVQVEIPNEKDKTCNYRIDSAAVVSMTPYQSATISSSLSKETVKTLKIQPSGLHGSHVENIGKIIEDVEIEFRSKLERVDIPKSLGVMQTMYQASSDISAASIIGIDASEEPMMTTGMGVGSLMIGEIANMAKKKQAAGNPFLDAMKAQQDAKEAQLKSAVESDSHYSDTKKTLKKAQVNPLGMEAMSAMKAKGDKAGAGFNDLKAGLKKKKVPAKQPEAAAVPSAEFMDFRNKLKKTSR